MTDIHVVLSELIVSALPADHVDHDAWSIRVSWRGDDQYAVQLRSQVLNRACEWEHERSPSVRDDAFIARTRFDYWTAYRLACEQAPLIKVNGKTAADILAKEPEETT